MKKFILILSILSISTAIWADLNADLFDAIKSNDLLTAEKLLLDKADVNFVNLDHDTPLITAIMASNKHDMTEMTKLLIRFGANVNQLDNWGRTILDYAAEYCFEIKTLQLLLKAGADATIKDNLGGTPLITACTYTNIEFVKLLLKTKVDVYAKEKTGYNALDYAVERSDKVLRILLDAGIKPDTHCLDIAVIYNDDITALMMLQNAGADINYRDNFGETLLFTAVSFNKVQIVRYLIGLGLNVNEQNTMGATPLMVAGRHHFAAGAIAEVSATIEIINELMNAGADLNIQDQEGKTALAYYLNWYSYPKTQTKIEKEDLIRIMIKAGADLDIQDNTGSTVLMQTMKLASNGYWDNKDIAIMLINAGTDLSLQDNTGKTALIKLLQPNTFHYWEIEYLVSLIIPAFNSEVQQKPLVAF